MFMGCEFGQFIEWSEYEELQWDLIEEYDIIERHNNSLKILNHFIKKIRPYGRLIIMIEGL